MTAPADLQVPGRHVAMGDPQAPMETVFSVLAAHGLLGDDGKVAPDVHLVVMGDYFDWGTREDRARAGESGERLLEWLAGHPKERVTLLLGNHDLARVGELAHVDDEAFARAQEEADAAYFGKKRRRAENEFAQATGFATWEIVARDFSTFRASQRALVERLLREGRFVVAHAAASDFLLTHAGVTARELGALDLDEEENCANAIAARLNERLHDVVRRWRSGPLVIDGLHRPGDATIEGVGMFYHRPEVRDAGTPGPRALAPMSRRYDIASLPVGLMQGIGHIRDSKCRQLLKAAKREGPEGAIHHATARAEGTTYEHGCPEVSPRDAATLVFLDGGMQHVARKDYELLDLTRRVPLRAGRQS